MESLEYHLRKCKIKFNASENRIWFVTRCSIDLEQQYALVINKLYQCKYSQGVTPLKDTFGLKNAKIFDSDSDFENLAQATTTPHGAQTVSTQ